METPNVWSMEPLESAGHSAGRAPWPRPRSAAAVVGTTGRASSEDRGQPHRWGSVGRREERLAAGACQGGTTRWCPDPSSTGRCGAGGRLTPARTGDQGGRHIRIQEGLGRRPGSVWWEVTERLGAFSTAPRLHPPHLGWCRPGRQGRWQRVGEDAEAEVMPAAGMEGAPAARRNLPRLAAGRGEATREAASEVQARREPRKGRERRTRAPFGWGDPRREVGEETPTGQQRAQARLAPQKGA